ncbi:MAG: hypothetical protein J7K02_04765 [Deltaproteobacteria bacterium]|nr:hypothetical protein [Deltaproteobacteria bacterium]
MNDAEIMQKANRVLQELEQELNTYQPLAWSIPWDIEAVEKMEGIIAFYEKRKGEWLRMLSGASEIARNTLIEFMRLADLEIEGAESVLFKGKGSMPKWKTLKT